MYSFPCLNSECTFGRLFFNCGVFSFNFAYCYSSLFLEHNRFNRTPRLDLFTVIWPSSHMPISARSHFSQSYPHNNNTFMKAQFNCIHLLIPRLSCISPHSWRSTLFAVCSGRRSPRGHIRSDARSAARRERRRDTLPHSRSAVSDHLRLPFAPAQHPRHHRQQRFLSTLSSQLCYFHSPNTQNTMIYGRVGSGIGVEENYFLETISDMIIHRNDYSSF